MIEKLEVGCGIEQVVEKVNEVIESLNKSADRRGPKSEREMTDADARRIIGGDMAKTSHKDAAEKLGLSYAQVYSARKEFTFKHIHKALKEEAKKAAEANQQ